MSTISVILEPDAAGVLHLPLPKGFHKGRVRVVATTLPEEGAKSVPEGGDATLAAIEAVRQRAGLKRRTLPPEEVEQRRKLAFEALDELRASNPYMDLADPVAWQREMREDRPLPYRD